MSSSNKEMKAADIKIMLEKVLILKDGRMFFQMIEPCCEELLAAMQKEIKALELRETQVSKAFPALKYDEFLTIKKMVKFPFFRVSTISYLWVFYCNVFFSTYPSITHASFMGLLYSFFTAGVCQEWTDQ